MQQRENQTKNFNLSGFVNCHLTHYFWFINTYDSKLESPSEFPLVSIDFSSPGLFKGAAAVFTLFINFFCGLEEGIEIWLWFEFKMLLHSTKLFAGKPATCWARFHKALGVRWYLVWERRHGWVFRVWGGVRCGSDSMENCHNIANYRVLESPSPAKLISVISLGVW